MATGGGLIGALRVSLGLDTASFEAGTKRARGIAARDASAIQKSLGGIKTAFAGLATLATASALVAAGKRALDYAASLGEVSQQLGVTTRDLQVYRFIATQVGIEQDTMDASLAKLTKSMGEADNGSKKQATAFRELGVSVKDANGNLLTAGDVLPKLADAFARIKDPITRARLETELLGKQGQKLDPLLSQGSAAINDMAAEADRLGLILGDALIKKADDASDRIEVLTKVLEVSFARAIAENADGILAFADAFISLVGAIGSAFSALQNFGYQARQTVNSLKGWTLTGAPVDSEAGRRARMAYFGNSVDKQAADERAANMGKTKLPKAVTQGAMPVARGSSPKAKKGPKDRTEQYLERFNRELAGLEDDQLQLQQQITTDINEKARLEHDRLSTAQAAYEFEVDSRQKQGELTVAQAAALKVARETNTQREHTLVNWKLDDDLVAQELSLARASLENSSTLLQGELAGARTQSERRRLQLEILANEQALAKASLEAVLALHTSTDAEKEIARKKLEQLGREGEQRAGAIRRDTMGPLASYLDGIPKTADEVNEAFENIAANGLQSLNDGIADAIMGSKNLADVFKNVANQIVADLIRIMVQKAITGAISDSLGGLFGGGGGGTGGKTARLASASSKIPKMASGGSFKVGGNGGVDRNLLAINGIPRARVSGNETITVNPANDRGGPHIEVVPSPYFNVVVDGRAAGVAGGMYASGTRANNRRGRQKLA